MAYANGQIPASELRACNGTSGAVLLPVQAASWNWLRAEVHRRFGWWPTITSAGDAYRSLARQIDVFQRYYTTSYAASAKHDQRSWNGRTWWRRPGYPSAATPGTSNHGKGVTVDVTGLGGFDSTRHRQFSEVAKSLGWSDAEGRKIAEPWHWNGHNAVAPVGAPGSGSGSIPSFPGVDPVAPIEEDDMYTDEDRKNATELRRVLGVIGGAVAPATDGERRLVARLASLDALADIRGDVAETRRMDGVLLGWQPPQGPEVNALKALRGGQPVPVSVDPEAVAAAVLAQLGPGLAQQVAERLTVTARQHDDVGRA